ncbi:LysR family transcriptional regulator [Agrobacterium tumefaciens]|uniref:HTH-type transcriptional regulator TtuA n=1 Tax=Agrobacterium tumefaciens TaxID=358 RepID=A0A2L2L7Q1_AGRTU|nr:LysR family transcriptional regulator [Agrobacterium tumefaciens]AVH40374.1 LysR family transcriptional regulator [Agrobacterium tumefaciens]NSY94347.1 LysR family transcriptional regulator [Agrobacterium tumefaciens]
MPDISLDLRYLRYAMIAAEYGSFRRVAQVIGVSQSTISRRIIILEHKIGFSLFERDHRGVKLTKAGAEFLREVATGVSHIEHAIGAALSMHRNLSGEIKIAMPTMLKSMPFQRIFRQLRDSHPGLKVRLLEGTTQENLARLVNRQADVIFSLGRKSISGHKSKILWFDKLLIALPEIHKLAAVDSIIWADLQNETFVISGVGPGPEAKECLMQQLAGPDFHPKIDMHDVGADGLMNLVAMGYGLTITSRSMSGLGWPGVVFKHIACPEGDLPVRAIWSPANSNPALKRFMVIAHAVSRDELDMSPSPSTGNAEGVGSRSKLDLSFRSKRHHNLRD